jgi:hypothetical protein
MAGQGAMHTMKEAKACLSNIEHGKGGKGGGTEENANIKPTKRQIGTK